MRAAVEVIIALAIPAAVLAGWKARGLHAQWKGTGRLIRDLRATPRAPAYLLDEAAAERTVIWSCGCTIAYLRDGGTLFASCGTHRRHPDWQQWEAQMAQEGQA